MMKLDENGVFRGRIMRNVHLSAKAERAVAVASAQAQSIVLQYFILSIFSVCLHAFPLRESRRRHRSPTA